VDDYDAGYGKPPKKTRFKPRTSGNLKGRPVRDPSLLGEIVNSVLEAPVQYRENGRTRTASRREVTLKLLVQRAIKGDVGAADNRAFATARCAADQGAREGSSLESHAGSGRSGLVEALAVRLKQERKHVSGILNLAFLAPDISKAILNGEQPTGLRLAHLLAADLPLSWTEQRALIRHGLPNSVP
jgi:hypothetical protein